METKLEEIRCLIQTLKYSKPEASVLTYLMLNNEATAHDIEREFNLRQPEVSIAITRLRKSHRIKKVNEMKTNSRPIDVYTLVRTWEHELDHTAKLEEDNYLSKLQSIEKVRRYFHEKNLS